MRQDLECTYPPSKQSSFVLNTDQDTIPANYSTAPSNAPQPATYPSDLHIGQAGDVSLFTELELSGFGEGLVENPLAPSWFTSLESWSIYRFQRGEQNKYNMSDLNTHMMRVFRWFGQWVQKGSNPIIHPRLYRTRFPRCIQDAYTTLGSYIHKNRSNEHTVFQILEDRAKQLVRDHGTVPEDSAVENVCLGSTTLDSLEHLARVQALLVYQLIGLYDGNIRLRHLSESYIPVLHSWMQQMVQHASQAVCLGGSIVSSSYEQTAIGCSLSDITHYENIPWYSWILSESIRRTWLVASGVQGTYLAFRGGKEASNCMGGMMFTTRQGVWDAPSSAVWEKLCSEVNVGLMQLAESDRLFTDAGPEEVDEFAKVILEVSFGSERMERWVTPIQEA